MTVFIAHAPADRTTAEALEAVIERRGHFVELDDGQTALRPVGGGDVFVLVVSQALSFATARLRLEQRALDAWASGRLIMVKLDQGFPPVGLRDLPMIDATFEAQREFKWNDVADDIREKLKAPVTAPAEEDDAHDVPAPAPPRAGAARGRGPSAVLLLLALLPGIGALVTGGAIWLVNRIGPTPGGLPELRAGVDQFGMRFGLPSGVTEWLFVAAIVLMFVAMGLLVARLFAPRPMAAESAPAPRPRKKSAAPKVTDVLFVSYARANETFVLPVIADAKKTGRKFWLDQQSMGGNEGWAGEIVRAIRSAAGVIVMCSQAAFESDHVKREIYLADRYKKKLVPVFIEDAEPPEDFEYFFAGVQPLKLFEKPEAERPQALIQVLGAT
ncbi:MAG: TIR domain-containing protein [Hyphomonadaceae bacterium]